MKNFVAAAVFLLGILIPLFTLASNANADELITNGGFESGLAGWTVNSGGNWYAGTGTDTPLNGNPTVGPSSGTGYAVTDQFGPGTNALSQDYTVPLGTTSLTLTFDMFVNDWAPTSGTASVTVQILDAGGDPVTGTGSVLLTKDTLVSAGNPNPYLAYDFSITGFIAGNSYVLDFLENDTAYPMNVGLDNVSLDAVPVNTTPVPSSLALLLSGLAAIGVLGRRRLWVIRRQGMALVVLAAIALLSQPVHAQNRNRNTGHPVVPESLRKHGHVRPYAWKATIVDPSAVVHGPGQTSCGAGAGQNVCYYFPTDVNTAYTTSFIPDGSDGTGLTVAITDAFFNSQTASDLATFSTAFGLPQLDGAAGHGTLTIVGQTCGAPPAQPSPITQEAQGWFVEEDLDVQWVHAIAPKANILLVIANSSSGADLYQAVQCAKTSSNVVVVTDSWGGSEYSGETSDDPAFSSQVPIMFSAGDAFSVLQYPCASPNVTCVGGTHLLETSTSHRSAESVWDEPLDPSGTGGGCSVYESEPPFQSGYSTCGAQRGVPDIAAIADEYTGVAVFLGSNAGGSGGCCNIIGGTSLASPVMAGIVALIDNSRLVHGKTIIGGSATTSNLTASIYNAAASPYYHYRIYDVTTGTDATAGWDPVTGLGVTLNPALTAYLNSLP